MFKLTFLGTSSGVPTKFRNVSALSVGLAGADWSNNSPWVLVDCGEATQHQLLKTKIKPSGLELVLITHLHGDHCYGLPGLLASLSMNGRQKPLTIIGPAKLQDFIQAVIGLTEINIGFDINFINVHDLIERDFIYKLSTNWHLSVRAYPLSHRCDSFAFSLTQEYRTKKLDIELLDRLGVPKTFWNLILNTDQESLALEGFGVLVVDLVIKQILHRQKIVIAGDNDQPALLADAVADAELLVHEATYTQAIKDKILAKNLFDPKHSSALQVATFAQKYKIPHLALTHFSARFLPFDKPGNQQPNMGHIRQEVKSVYQGQLTLAEDFLQLDTVSLTNDCVTDCQSSAD